MIRACIWASLSDSWTGKITLPARLRDARVKFCIAGSERTANVRNLPYHAGTAAAHGLTKDEALRAITLSVAEILGVADRIGSLEAGKDADLAVWATDPERGGTAALRDLRCDLTLLGGRVVHEAAHP